VNRRSFLAATSVLLAGRVKTSEAQSGQTPRMTGQSAFDPWVEVHTNHLRQNVAEVARLTKRPVLAVIKNNGYGLGVTPSAKALEPSASVHGFAVVKLQEALDLRAQGIKKPVLLMAPFDERDLQAALASDIMPMVYTPIGDLLDREAQKLGRPIAIHVCVDTGLGRVGVPHAQAAALIRDLAARKGVTIAGMQMTYTEDFEFDREQTRRFTALASELKGAGINVGRLHAASTYTLFQHGEEAHFDMVRVGMGLLGIYPDAKFRAMKRLTLRPAVALRVRVAYVKELAAGASAGYERAYIAKKNTWIATLPVGHADGWPRAAAKGGRVRINGRMYPIIASVSASHTLVEIGDTPAVKAGDEATLFDWEDGSRPEDVAAVTGASVYDLTMHLNPLLPRLVIT
jgi:alanine racemase